MMSEHTGYQDYIAATTEPICSLEVGEMELQRILASRLSDILYRYGFKHDEDMLMKHELASFVIECIRTSEVVA